MDAAQAGDVTEPPRVTFRVIAGVCIARLLSRPAHRPAPRRSSHRALVCHRAAADAIT